MGHHYTKNTIEASAWCRVCNRHTPHRVCDRRLDSCLNCIERLNREHAERAAKPAPPTQENLFNHDR
jgi:hypothetical protein